GKGAALCRRRLQRPWRGLGGRRGGAWAAPGDLGQVHGDGQLARVSGQGRGHHPAALGMGAGRGEGEECMSKLQTAGNASLGERTSIKALLSQESVRKRFEEMLGRRAAGFMSSVINLVNSDQNLQACDPRKVLGCAAIAASMDLPVDKNLGFAWIIPYKDNRKGTVEPQFQMGYKGYIQLAMRTG